MVSPLADAAIAAAIVAYSCPGPTVSVAVKPLAGQTKVANPRTAAFQGSGMAKLHTVAFPLGK
jgi:hypothetical protein